MIQENETIDHHTDKENVDSNNSNAILLNVDVPIVPESENEIQHKNTHTSHATGAKSDKQPLLFTGGYFEIISKGSAGIKAKCLHCPNHDTFSAAQNVTSNLITHLRKVRIFVSVLFISMNVIEHFSFIQTATPGGTWSIRE